MAEATRAPAQPRESLLTALAVYLRPRVLIVLLLGFSSGLPLALSGATLAIWMTDRGVDLGTIGLFSLVGLPYTFKFLWAPVVDALDVPLLSRALGRRRGWLVFSQIVLAVTIVLLGMLDPAAAPFAVAVAALMVAAASATQDIVIDAFRVESLDTSEQAAGMASYVFAYRIGMLVSGAGVIALVAWLEHIGVARDQVWMWGYLAAAAFVAIGFFAALLAREPEAPAELRAGKPRGDAVTRVLTTAFEAFREFLARDAAIAVLLFVVLFKFCDAFAGVLTGPFVISIGFDKAAYAGIVKGVGLAALLIGGIAGGVVARALPLVTSLWIAALLQMASNFVFVWQAWVGVNHAALT
ncbi:MAG TPA: MFS transporter, partial [Xanthobacteraceae bacterium]